MKNATTAGYLRTTQQANDAEVGTIVKLAPEVSQRIRDCLVALIGPSKIIIFGSYARGAATAASDIDIAAIAREGQPHDRETRIRSRQALRRVLKDANLAFDFILESKETFERERRTAGSFEHTLDVEGVVIYEQR